MSPVLNGSFALQHFEHGNAVEIDNRMFDFYLGLLHYMISGFVGTYRAQNKVAGHSKQQPLAFINNKLRKGCNQKTENF